MRQCLSLLKDFSKKSMCVFSSMSGLKGESQSEMTLLAEIRGAMASKLINHPESGKDEQKCQCHFALSDCSPDMQ